MPLTSTGQFYPGQRRGVPFQFPGMQGDNGYNLPSQSELPSFQMPGMPGGVGRMYDPGFTIPQTPEMQRRTIFNHWMNSKNAGFNGWQTLVDYVPPAAGSPQMGEAEAWWNQRQQQPQGMIQLAGGPAVKGQPYQWGPFQIMPGSPFHPKGNGWSGYFNPPPLPAMGMGESTQQRSYAPPSQQQFAAPPAPMPPPNAPIMAAPPAGPMQRPMQQFSEPSMPPPMAGQLVPNSQVGAPTQQQIDHGRTLPGYYRSIGPENPSGVNMANGGYYSSPVTSQTQFAPFSESEGYQLGRQVGFRESSFGDQGLMPESYKQFMDGGRFERGQQQESPLTPPAGGTPYAGGSMAVTLPNGRTALAGRGIVDAALQNVPRDANAQQRQDAVLAYYQSLAQSSPGNYGQSARTALGMRGPGVAYQGYSQEQQYNMARNANIAQGGTGEGTYQEIMGDNNRRYVAPRIAERTAMAEERRRQLAEGQSIRRESILERQYGPAAQRRFAIENEARTQTQRSITQQNVGQIAPQVEAAVPTVADPNTGARITDTSPNGFSTWLANLETTRGEKWADEALAAIDSGKVPWNREQAMAALQAQEKDMSDFTSGIGVLLDGEKKAALSRAANRHNQLRQRLGLDQWIPRHTPPWPISIIDSGNGTPLLQ